ncbi:MAG TPA: hypothetical protein VNS09_14890 [Solirubrobacter sp.]|nr:hypothetical protein [Solirubrobacter sp.]
MVLRISLALWLAFMVLLVVEGAWLIAAIAAVMLGLRVYSLRFRRRPRPAPPLPVTPSNPAVFDVARDRPRGRRRR